MTAKAAICKALLLGKVLNIGNGFKLFGVTNIPREIGRSVERSFNVKCNRKDRTGVSRYDVTTRFTDYSLKLTPANLPGIKAMVKYVLDQEGEPKTQHGLDQQAMIKEILKVEL